MSEFVAWVIAFLFANGWEVVSLLIAIPAAIVGGIRFRKWWQSWQFRRVRNGRASEILDRALKRANDGNGAIWRQQPSFPNKYHENMRYSIPILMVANLKGGVGKTTIAANLAAHFAAQGFRVLAIDLDFQGSMTSMMMEHVARQQSQNIAKIQAQAARYLSPGENYHQFDLDPTKYSNELELDFIGAHYDLDNLEQLLLIRWLLEDCKQDIRYQLAAHLLEQQFQARYDIIIIDTPPRLTTGFINALCCSTHLLIPTILDRLSADSVNDFLMQLEILRPQIAPNLKLAGIVGTLTHSRGDFTNLTDFENNTLQRIDEKALHAFGDPTRQYAIRDLGINRAAAIGAHAGETLAYFQNVAVRANFAALGEVLAPLLVAPPQMTAHEPQVAPREHLNGRAQQAHQGRGARLRSQLPSIGALALRKKR